MRHVYLDNSATTKPCSEAIAAINDALTVTYGNPSSLHGYGSAAAELLLSSRNEIICSLFGESVRNKLPRRAGMRGGEEYGKIIFTASGTEADNLAVFGTLNTCRISSPEIITTDSEHPAILNAVEQLENKGVKVHKLSTKNGVIDLEQLKSFLSPKTALVSVMHVNNETGAVYDLKRIFDLVKSVSSDAVCHADCVQSYLKIPVDPIDLNADMITLSAHKVHGVKGVGALWVKADLIRKNRPSPIVFGGGQESAFRSGTENLPGIAAFAAAVKAQGGANAHKAFGNATAPLRQKLISLLPEKASVNLPEGEYAPHILSVTLPIPKSQPMLNQLSALGFYVSSGSACSSHKNTVSHVLKAFGLSDKSADATVRISLSAENTEEEITAFAEALTLGVKRLGK